MRRKDIKLYTFPHFSPLKNSEKFSTNLIQLKMNVL